LIGAGPTRNRNMKNPFKLVKKKYSFEGVKHALKIDQDIWDSTQQYVIDQINIMKRHGSQPEPPLTEMQFNDLVYVTAKYSQQVRNLRKQLEK
jgi:hypothetical protein